MTIRHFKRRRRVKEARLGYLVQAVLPSRQPSPVKSLFNKAVLHHKKTLTCILSMLPLEHELNHPME